jgi:hypothetical protein
LFMFNWTLWNNVCIVCCCDLCPLSRYFDTFGNAIYINKLALHLENTNITTNLARHRNLFTVFQSYRTLVPFRVIKNNSHTGFRDTSLTPLIDQVLLVLCSHLHQTTRFFNTNSTTLCSARTWDIFVIPRTKQIASRMLDLPEPFRPVIALNDESHPVIWVRTGYDLKPKNPLSTI